jgi:hypothetical protein
VVLSGALNVLGLRRLIVTGLLADLSPAVMSRLRESVLRGSLWARFGDIEIESARRRRIAGLVAIGIDRLVLPMEKNAGVEEGAPARMVSKASSGWLGFQE